MSKLIGRVLATEKSPTTMDKFTFWTNSDLKLHAFDIVKVQHIEGSYTFGVIENISHITDAQSFLTNFISSDFGDVTLDEPTLRIGMNYVEASVSYNSRGIYTPVHNNAQVFLASSDEINTALGLKNVKNPLVCGSLKMYEGTDEEVTLPVHLNSQFILGPEGAHLNISGISGLASKTSYAMFLMKAIQERYLKKDSGNLEDSVAFVIFNVKGRDLMAIHRENEFEHEPENERERVRKEYEDMNLSFDPFRNVSYYVPYYTATSAKQSTYLSRDDVEDYRQDGILKKFKYSYQEDKESLEMLFADVDDPQQTMESIISKIVDKNDPDFGTGVGTWNDLLDKVNELSQKSQSQSKGQRGGSNEINVLSWRKFKRIINKALKNDDMFANRPDPSRGECRLADELKHIRPNSVQVIQAVLNSTKGKVGPGVEFFEEAFGRDVYEYQKLLWMPETFIIFRRRYDANLRNRLADKYTDFSEEDNDLANEWWADFCALPKEKLEIAKGIIAKNQFKKGDYECDDLAVMKVLSYYSISR